MSELIRTKQLSTVAVYDDTVAAGSGLEVAELSDTINFTFNGIFSQLNKVIGLTNWFDATSDGGSMSLNSFTNNIMCGAQVLTAVTVTGSQNWEILSVSGSEAPSLGGNTATATSTATEGAASATSAFSGAGFDVHELVERGNSNDGGALSPLNLVSVIDSTTRQLIQSDNGNDVLALMQVESTFSANGAVFNDTSAGNRVKLSFVRVDSAGTDLEPVPVADIEGLTIFYNYPVIKLLGNVDPACFTGKRGFVDQTASIDVTRQNAYTNQGTTVVVPLLDSTLDLTLTKFWEIGDGASASLLRITEGSGGGTTTVALGTAVDTFDSEAVLNDFANSLDVETDSGTGMRVGESSPASGKFGVYQNIAASDLQFINNVAGGGIVIATAPSAAVATSSINIVPGASSGVGAFDGGDVIITGASVSGLAATGQGGSVVITAGGDLTAGGTGSTGTVDFVIGGAASEVDPVIRLLNGGSGTGGGEDIQVFTGTSNPNTATVSADAASLFAQDTGSGATLWLNTSTGTGVTWRRFLTSGGPKQESITTEVITGSDTVITDTLDATPVSDDAVVLYLNGVFQRQGATFAYTISGSTITWLASSGTAVDMDTSDELIAVYHITT